MLTPTWSRDIGVGIGPVHIPRAWPKALGVHVGVLVRELPMALPRGLKVWPCNVMARMKH